VTRTRPYPSEELYHIVVIRMNMSLKYPRRSAGSVATEYSRASRSAIRNRLLAIRCSPFAPPAVFEGTDLDVLVA